MDESLPTPGVGLLWKTEVAPRLRVLPVPGDRYVLVLDRAGDLDRDCLMSKPAGAEALLVFADAVELA